MQNDASDSGFIRLFNFLTPAARMILAPPAREARGGIVGGVTLEDFLAKAASPALEALDGCKSVKLVGKATINEGSMTRGARARPPPASIACPAAHNTVALPLSLPVPPWMVYI